MIPPSGCRKGCVFSRLPRTIHTDFFDSSESGDCNGRDSFQLFVGVFDTFPVWYLLVLPSETHAIVNMTSLMAIDGDTSYHSCESFSFKFGKVRFSKVQPSHDAAKNVF